MATLNKVMLIGRLTDNPEPPRAMPSGGMVIKFRFAVGRSKKNAQGGWDPDPNPLYIDCEAFSRPDAKRDLVNLIQQFCKKGDSLYIEGRLVFDQWEDKNGGGKRSKHKVVVDNLEFVGSKQDGGGGGGGGDGEGSPRMSRPMSSNTGGRSAPPRSAPPPDDDEYGGNSGNSGGGGGDDIPF